MFCRLIEWFKSEIPHLESLDMKATGAQTEALTQKQKLFERRTLHLRSFTDENAVLSEPLASKYFWFLLEPAV